jgi:hypothetical protein
MSARAVFRGQVAACPQHVEQMTDTEAQEMLLEMAEFGHSLLAFFDH